MLPLPLPVITHEISYDLARERFTLEEYVARIANGKGDVLAHGVNYTAMANAGRLSEIARAGSVPPHLLEGDMQTLYSQGLLRKNSSARSDVYEKIRVSSPYRVCPFCLHRTVKTLDHYLPKDEYAAFAVLPANLVPCCRDCNSEKLCFVGVDRSQSLIHPYFDRVDDVAWLGCDLAFQNGHWAPTFYVNSDAVGLDLRLRLMRHMEVLDLFDLYDLEGARELNDMRLAIRRTFQSGGAEAVNEHCVNTADSRKALAENYWRAILWEVAAQNDAFCSATWA